MLRLRLLSALVIVSLLLGLVWLDAVHAWPVVRGFWLAPLFMACAVLGIAEMLDLFRSRGYQPLAWPCYLGGVGAAIGACAPLIYECLGWSFPVDNPLGRFGWPLMALTAGMMLALMGEMRRFREPGVAVVNVALSLFAMTYIGGLLAFLAMLRLMPGEPGLTAIISLLAIVKCSDTGAYAAGKNFGRTKLTPILSPGKTVEGLLGGLIAGVVVSIVFFHFVAPWVNEAAFAPPSHLAAGIYGLVLSAAGVFGDLAESLIKRDMQRKDSSSWLPGLGGVLDILDSVLFAAPVAWLCWMLGLV